MSKSYKELSGFENVYLEDSYVLNLIETPSTLAFDLELILTEKHPLYTSPIKGERYCYKKAQMRFDNYQNAKWVEKSFNPTPDLDGSIDYGNVDTFSNDNGVYHLSGDWGILEITGSTPVLEIKE